MRRSRPLNKAEVGPVVVTGPRGPGGDPKREVRLFGVRETVVGDFNPHH